MQKRFSRGISGVENQKGAWDFYCGGRNRINSKVARTAKLFTGVELATILNLSLDSNHSRRSAKF